MTRRIVRENEGWGGVRTLRDALLRDAKRRGRRFSDEAPTVAHYVLSIQRFDCHAPPSPSSFFFARAPTSNALAPVTVTPACSCSRPTSAASLSELASAAAATTRVVSEKRLAEKRRRVSRALSRSAASSPSAAEALVVSSGSVYAGSGAAGAAAAASTGSVTGAAAGATAGVGGLDARKVCIPQNRSAETRSSSPRSSSLRNSLSSHGARPRPVSAASTAASWGLLRCKGKARGRGVGSARETKRPGSVLVVRSRRRAHAPAHGSVRALEDVLRDINEAESEFALGRRGDCHGRLEGARDTASGAAVALSNNGNFCPGTIRGIEAKIGFDTIRFPGSSGPNPVSFYSAILPRLLPLFVRSDARRPPSLLL